MDHVGEKRWVTRCRFLHRAFTLTLFPEMVGRDVLFVVVACDAPVTGALAAAPHRLGRWRHSKVNWDSGGELLKNPKAGECDLGR